MADESERLIYTKERFIYFNEPQELIRFNYAVEPNIRFVFNANGVLIDVGLLKQGKRSEG